MGAEIRVRRVYDAPSPEDGARVLVDRVWPRGLRKDAARLDEWAKDVAPSTELRIWYRHDPAKFDEFRQRYTAELAQPGPRGGYRPAPCPGREPAGNAADRDKGTEPQPGRRTRRVAERGRVTPGTANYRVSSAAGWRAPGSFRAVRRATHKLGSTNGSSRSTVTGARIRASAPRISPRCSEQMTS